MTEMKNCPVCNQSIKLENLEKHVKKVHPRAKVDIEYSEKETKSLKKHEQRQKELTKPTGLWKAGTVIAVIAVIIIAAVVLLPAEERPPPPPPGSPAPSFELMDIDNNLISTEKLKGEKEIVYLDFFQTECGHCQQNTLNTLVPIYGEYGDKIKMISISINPTDTVQKIIEFKSNWGKPQWQYALDANGEIWEDYKYVVTPQGVKPGTPSSVLIDSNGNLSHTHVGEENYAALAAQIEALLE
jgi:peroxiredoxin